MIYAKAVMTGIGTAFAAAVLYVAGAIAVGFVLPLLIQRLRSTGGGAAAFVISSGPVLACAATGFAAGFYWKLRKGWSGAPRK